MVSKLTSRLVRHGSLSSLPTYIQSLLMESYDTGMLCLWRYTTSQISNSYDNIAKPPYNLFLTASTIVVRCNARFTALRPEALSMEGEY